MAELHINVGIVALARGLITLETFAGAMKSLVAGGQQSLGDLWVCDGRLDAGQLAMLLDAIGPTKGRDTMVLDFDAVGPTGQVAVTQAAGSPANQANVETRPIPFGADGLPAGPIASAEPPELFGNRYRTLGPLGAGGLGEVSACEDTVLRRTVAVKAGHKAGGPDEYAAKVILAREARIISGLEHPNIIPIYDAGTDSKRGPFYVMRQVTEQSLQQILKRKAKGEGDPRDYTLHRLLRYFLQVCNAVDYAHHRGVIHCDIKPANILLGDYGEVLLVDWGLAQSREHPLPVRGGTLGYMAPEQMDTTIERLDERADVFALGSILYEILAGHSAFPERRNSDITTLGGGLKNIYQPPPVPTAVASDIHVPREVEDICMRALAIDREDRLPNARLLATAIDEFIEGSKERERRRIEADKGAAAGEELAERYHEFVESRPDKVSMFHSLRAEVAPWAGVADKQDLWDAEDIVRVTDALQVRTFHSAVSAFERALDQVPGHARSRRGLARLYWSELQRARQRGNVLDQIAYEQLLRESDDGTFTRELQRDGTLELQIAEHVGKVTLAMYVERERRLVHSTTDEITERPLAKRSLPAGRYLVCATIGDGPRQVSWPISIEPGTACTLAIDPPAAKSLTENEVFIPAGPARLGGDTLSTESDEPVIVDVPAFVLQRYPVTFSEWFEFLDDLRLKAPHLVEQHRPRTTVGVPSWNATAQGWVADSSVPAITLPPDPSKLPVFGVSVESAEAYAAWLSARDGKAWRLPTELEWEKAGRGTDARAYPWGEHFDATFCKLRDSRAGQPAAEDIGRYPHDVSPYGVHDLAGGVADWCIPDERRSAAREPREVVSRGGAWCDWPIDCRLASRRRYLATEHSARVGVRLAREP